MRPATVACWLYWPTCAADTRPATAGLMPCTRRGCSSGAGRGPACSSWLARVTYRRLCRNSEWTTFDSTSESVMPTQAEHLVREVRERSPPAPTSHLERTSAPVLAHAALCPLSRSRTVTQGHCQTVVRGGVFRPSQAVTFPVLTRPSSLPSSPLRRTGLPRAMPWMPIHLLLLSGAARPHGPWCRSSRTPAADDPRATASVHLRSCRDTDPTRDLQQQPRPFTVLRSPSCSPLSLT